MRLRDEQGQSADSSSLSGTWVRSDWREGRGSATPLAAFILPENTLLRSGTFSGLEVDPWLQGYPGTTYFRWTNSFPVLASLGKITWPDFHKILTSLQSPLKRAAHIPFGLKLAAWPSNTSVHSTRLFEASLGGGEQRSLPLTQRSPTILAPGAGFGEGSSSTDGGDGSGRDASDGERWGAMGGGRRSFTRSPAAHLPLCGPVPNRPRTGILQLPEVGDPCSHPLSSNVTPLIQSSNYDIIIFYCFLFPFWWFWKFN